jgi:hypothetical protein
MNDYSYILEKTIPTEKMRAIVSIMIPQMVRWAQNGETDKTYLDMIHVLNMSRWSGIGYALGFVEDVMQVLRKESGKHDIPSLNTLCNKTSTRLPSDGLSYVYKEYKLMSTAAKRIFVKGINQKIVLIDGSELAKYMIEYNVGVSVKNVYEIKRIDNDYFED